MQATRHLALAALATLGLAAAQWTHPQAAQAQNLVQDGDFEQAAPSAADDSTTGFTPGDTFDGFWKVDFGSVGIDTTDRYVLDGAKSLFLTDGGFGAVTQTLATTPGQAYTISFLADADAPNALFASFDGTLLSGGTPILVPQNGFPNGYDPAAAASLFTRYSFTALASSAST